MSTSSDLMKHLSILELLIHAMDVEGEVLIQMSDWNMANYLIFKW